MLSETGFSGWRICRNQGDGSIPVQWDTSHRLKGRSAMTRNLGCTPEFGKFDMDERPCYSAWRFHIPYKPVQVLIDAPESSCRPRPLSRIALTRAASTPTRTRSCRLCLSQSSPGAAACRAPSILPAVAASIPAVRSHSSHATTSYPNGGRLHRVTGSRVTRSEPRISVTSFQF